MPKNKVTTMKEYGAVTVNLKQVMDRCGMNRNTLARSIGTRFEVVDKWYRGEIEKLDLDILARICYVLDCGTEDILSYRR